MVYFSNGFINLHVSLMIREMSTASMYGLNAWNKTYLSGNPYAYWWPTTIETWLKHIDAETKWPPFSRLLENVCISLKISLKFAPKDPTNTISSLLKYWRIYASLVLNELSKQCTSSHIIKHLYGVWKIRIQSGNHVDCLIQKRGNSSTLAMELRLSCSKPSTCTHSSVE